MKILSSFERFRAFQIRSLWRIGMVMPVGMIALFAPEPYSRFAMVIGITINFVSFEYILAKLRGVPATPEALRAMLSPVPPFISTLTPENSVSTVLPQETKEEKPIVEK